MVHIIDSIENRFRIFFRSIRMRKWRKCNRNFDFSLICNNCVGAMVVHDLGVQFNSPTVNLFIYPTDYLKFLENLNVMQKSVLKDITPSSSLYPIGLLNGVVIHFLHYKSFDEATTAWNRRMKRLNLENMYVVLIERDGCTHEELLRFDRLPFKHKVVLTHCRYEDIKCSRKISGYEDCKEVGTITDWDGLWGKRLYDRYDWVKFLNFD